MAPYSRNEFTTIGVLLRQTASSKIQSLLTKYSSGLNLIRYFNSRNY